MLGFAEGFARVCYGVGIGLVGCCSAVLLGVVMVLLGFVMVLLGVAMGLLGVGMGDGVVMGL